MNKYYDILKEILIANYNVDSVSIENYLFTELGVVCVYSYYSKIFNERLTDSVTIFNSQLNAYMFEYDKK